MGVSSLFFGNWFGSWLFCCYRCFACGFACRRLEAVALVNFKYKLGVIMDFEVNNVAKAAKGKKKTAKKKK
jgi:hypothetical protein